MTLRRLTDEGELDPDQEALTLEVELTPPTSRPYREAFDMQLRDQEPGRYLLEVEVYDRVRDQRVLRSASLELVR